MEHLKPGETQAGKTKEMTLREDGNLDMTHTDNATGEGGVFDPGSNEVGGQIMGKAEVCFRANNYFMQKLQEAGILTHWMDVNPDRPYTAIVKSGKNYGFGIEVIVRFDKRGSFAKRYPQYVQTIGEPLDTPVVEFTLKYDADGAFQKDPLINKSVLVALGILTARQHDKLERLALQVAEIIKSELDAKGMTLCDMKIEPFRDKDGNNMVGDEISPDCWRIIGEDGEEIDAISFGRMFFASEA